MSDAKDIATTNPGTDVASLLRAAVESGLAPESLEKLVELQIRMRAEDARAAFAADYAELQGDLPTVLFNRQGHTNDYADLAQIERTIKPHCRRYGFSHSFSTRRDGDERVVVCHLRHRLGHVEESEFPIMIDNNAKAMNPSQRIASGSSYAKRYALCNALSISTSDMIDDDAESLHETITEQEAADLAAMAEDVGADVKKFLKWARVESFGDILAADKPRLVKALEAKRAAA